eukprot:5251679-Pyramimonas_sp.AAC.1
MTPNNIHRHCTFVGPDATGLDLSTNAFPNYMECLVHVRNDHHRPNPVQPSLNLVRRLTNPHLHPARRLENPQNDAARVACDDLPHADTPRIKDTSFSERDCNDVGVP